MTIGLIGRENELYILKIRFDRLHTRTHTLQTPHTLQTTSKLSYLHTYTYVELLKTYVFTYK